MAAQWAFGSVPIFVSERSSSREIKRAELFPLDATSSTYQFFGAGSRHYSIKGIITSGSYLNQLETYAIGDSPQTFSTPYGDVANAKIHKEVKATTIKYSGATIDGVSYLADNDELMEIELEIIF